jgi:hypothetical protein
MHLEGVVATYVSCEADMVKVEHDWGRRKRRWQLFFSSSRCCRRKQLQSSVHWLLEGSVFAHDEESSVIVSWQIWVQLGVVHMRRGYMLAMAWMCHVQGPAKPNHERHMFRPKIV